MKYARKTLKSKINFSGRSLHMGQSVHVVVHPHDKGIWFSFGGERWEARPENVTDTQRCTRLGLVATIEHLMSAFAGTEITDAVVELDAPELPALDGSAGPYLEAISSVGTEEVGSSNGAHVFSRIFVQDDQAKIAVSAGEGHWRYEFVTSPRWPGEQVLDTPDVVAEYPKIANARTFAFQEELPMIEAAGLGRGLDSDSALILGPDGYLNAERCEDEPVRHKMLDAIGDIYLAGIPIRFLNVSAVRTGHTATVKAAAALRLAAQGAVDR